MSIAFPQEDHTTPAPRACSEARLKANRLNAQKSTGPKTAEGKQKSSQNARKHGLCSTSALLPGEDEATYHLFEDELREELQPRTALQYHLFQDIARHLWKLRRLPDAERRLFSLEADGAKPTDSSVGSSEPLPPSQLLAQAFHANPTKNPFLLLNRYERSLHNAFLRLLSRYHQLQKQPLPTCDESVPRELALPYPIEPIPTQPGEEKTPAAASETTPTPPILNPRSTKRTQSHAFHTPASRIQSADGRDGEGPLPTAADRSPLKQAIYPGGGMHNSTNAGLNRATPPRRPTRPLVLAAAVPFALPAAARAATDTYSGPGGNWSDPTNWSLTRPPLSGEDALLTNGPAGQFGDVAVSFDAAASTGTGLASVFLQGTNGAAVTLSQSDGAFTLTGTEDIAKDFGTRATLALSGGTHSATVTNGTSIILGNSAGSTGSITVSLSASLNAPNFSPIHVGFSGNGDVQQSGGAVAATNLYLGTNPGSRGAYALTGGTLTTTFENVGGAGDASFTQSGGSHTIYHGNIAVSAGSTATYFLHAGTLNNNEDLIVGRGGAGTFEQDGGSLTVKNILYVGPSINSTTGTGTFNLRAGALTVFGGAGGQIGIEVASPVAGGATFNQTGGSASTTYLHLGRGNATSGTYNLSAGTLTSSFDQVAGFSGSPNTGTFNHTGGSNSVAGALILGNLGFGQYNLSGTSTLSIVTSFGVPTSGELRVGVSSPGAFVQTGGSATVAASLKIGVNAAGSGTSTLSAGTVAIARSALVGVDGAGTLAVSGGTFAVNGTGTNGLFLAYNPSSTGNATLSGGLLSVASSEFIGARGKGTFTQSGGTHTVAARLVVSASPGTSTGTFNLQGGSLSAANLQVNAAGTFTQTGGTLTITGPATNHATLSLLAGSAALNQLSGTGSTVIGSPSGASSTVTLNRLAQNALTLDATGTLTITPQSPRQTNSATALTLNPGGTRDLTTNDLLVDRTATPADLIRSYLTGPSPRLISSTANADPQHLALGYADSADAMVDPAILPAGQVLVKYTLPGDANLDGRVNNSDLTLLRANFGTVSGGEWDDGDFNYDSRVNNSDLALARANFGSSIAPDTLAAFNTPQSTPEPGALTTLTLAAAIPLLHRRRRKRHRYSEL